MRKNILAPSILAADFTRLGEEIGETVNAGAEYIHIDVMDGWFVPSISFGMPVIKSIRKSTEAFFDVHLMVQDPGRYIEDFARCGADSITVHAEACTHLDRVIGQIRETGCKAAVALNPSTPLTALDYVLEKVDMVLLMTVNPGFGGQKYIENMTDKIRALRALTLEKGLETAIQVDGGINAETIRLPLGAGANVIVSGSAIFGRETGAKTREFLSIMKEYDSWDVKA